METTQAIAILEKMRDELEAKDKLHARHASLHSQYAERTLRDIVEAFDPISETMMRESDRGATMVAQSTLDGILFHLFSNIFTQSAEGIKTGELAWLLKGSLAPLGGFYRRIQMAYGLGLIGRDLKKVLEDLNDIRIEPAHSGEPFQFDEASIGRLLAKLNGLSKGGVSKHAEIFRDSELVRSLKADWGKTYHGAPIETRLQFVACTMVAFALLKLLQLSIAVEGWPPEVSEDVCQRMEAYLSTPRKNQTVVNASKSKPK